MPEPRLPIYACEAWRIDLGRRELRADASVLPLGERAFDVLVMLVRSAGRLVRKHELLGAVWAGAAVEENTLQVHVSAIRRALGADRTLLKTVMGRGYRLDGAWTIEDSAALEVARPRCRRWPGSWRGIAWSCLPARAASARPGWRWRWRSIA